MKDFIKRIVFWFYPRFFGGEPGPLTLNFIKNIGYVGVGFVSAAVLSVLTQVYIGRVVGPEQYGIFALIRSTSVFLLIPLALGNTGLVKYLAESKSKERMSQVIMTSFLLMTVALIVLLPLFYLARSSLSSLITLPKPYFKYAIVFTVGYLLLDFSKRFLQGLRNMKKLSFFEFLRSVAALMLVALVLFVLNLTGVKFAVMALAVGWSIPFFILLPRILGHLSARLDVKLLNVMARYAWFNLLGSASYAVMSNVDRMLISRYLGLSSVGLYEAYFFATMGVANYLMIIFDTVFFPEVSRHDRRVMWAKMKHILKISPFIYLATLLSGVVIITLFGSEYGLGFSLLLFFPLLCAVRFVYGMYNWYSMSLGVKGVRNSFVSITVAALLDIGLNILLLPKLGLLGAVLAALIAYLIVMPFLLSRSKHLMEDLYNSPTTLS